MEESTFMDGVRAVFAVIDRGVYGLITTFYNLIESLATFTIIDSGTIVEISGRIYALIALFMIFKISFSLINYLVNPDILSDKVKGGGSLIKNIIITFALVVIVPFGFDLLYQAQAAILSDNLIGKLIHGGEAVDGQMEFLMDDTHCDKKATTKNSGDYIGLMAFKPFFQLSEESLKNSNDFSGDTKDWYCEASVYGGDGSVKNLLANNKVYSAPHGWSAEKFYVVDYTIFLSTIVGVILALVFLSFCFDVATRTIKLQFLEILAPIPVISYIDPDKSKSGMFSKWLKEVATTWLSLFMRLLAYNIAIYAISLIGDMKLEGDSLWIRLLIIIGILMFAKELPKLLENIMGIKMAGSFDLNPFKKIGDNALGGKMLTGAAVAGAGLAATGIAQSTSNAYNFARTRHNLKHAIKNEKDPGKREKLQRQFDGMGVGRFMATTSGGFVGGARRGVVSGYKTGHKGSANIFSGMKSDLKSGNTARNNRTNIRNYNREVKHQYETDEISKDAYKEQRYGFFERNVTERLDQASGLKNEHGGYGYYDKKIKDLDRDIENNNQKEQSLRNALSQLCVNNGINLSDFEENYKRGITSSSLPADSKDEDVIKRRNAENSAYAAIKEINDIDAATKELKAKKKNYSDMMSARQNAEKK